MTAKTIKLIDDGKTYHIANEEGFQKFLDYLETPFLEHLETQEGVFRFSSLVPGGNYRTKHHADTVINFDEKAAFINRLKKVAHQLERDGEYDRAKVALELILSHQKTLFGGDQHPDIVQTHVRMAVLAGLQGDFAGGMESYHHALQVGLKVFGLYDPVVAEIYTAAGHYLSYSGLFKDALHLYQCSLRIHAKVSSGKKQSKSVADGFMHCGMALEKLGEYQKALACHQKALSVVVVFAANQNDDDGNDVDRNYDHRHKVAQIQCHMASTLNRLGDYFEARNHYQAALSIHQALCAEPESRKICSSSDSSANNETGRGPTPVVS